MYYSGWMEPFQVRFAETAARHHAVPLVQIDPTDISLTAIAAGQYDPYLRSYATAVRAFGGRVIISFGHEMNGNWYSWGYQHTSPAAFVAAWRHIVTVFRQQGASNVTWLWAVNVIASAREHPVPGRMVARQLLCELGGDRRLLLQAVLDVRLPVRADHQGRPRADPRPDPDLRDRRRAFAGKPAKIADLFAGVRAYGLLGFVWFNANKHRDWRISDPAASAAFRRGARAYQGICVMNDQRRAFPRHEAQP